MKIYIGVTDDKWFDYLSHIKPDEVNFWQPSGRNSFRVLEPNELFLFKLHSPNNFIVGGGYFVSHSFLPASIAWEAMKEKNGTNNYYDFLSAIHKYRKSDYKSEPDPKIGNIILSSPFFFNRSQWIPVPESWKSNIVQGKSYDTSEKEGYLLEQRIIERLSNIAINNNDSYISINEEIEKYGTGQIIYPRLGQGAFRILVTEAYNKKCAITGEKTLPVLDAAHIKPYSQEGPHEICNGILFRKDIHTLFDIGYITINEDYRVEVSKRIKKDYGNGKEYYAMHGRQLIEIPNNKTNMPDKKYLLWHNEKIFIA